MPLLKLDQVVIKDLGIKQYQETFSAMKDFVAKGEDESIWMLEHDPVFTLGTAADQKHILKITDIDVFQAEDGIRDPDWSRGLGDVYKRQIIQLQKMPLLKLDQVVIKDLGKKQYQELSLIHI